MLREQVRLKKLYQCTKGYKFEEVYRKLAREKAFKNHAQVIEKEESWSDGVLKTVFYITA